MVMTVTPAQPPDHAWGRKPNFAFIDADNIYKSACQLLQRREIDPSKIDQFDLRRLFYGHDRCFIYNALDDASEIPSWLKELQNTQGFIAKFGRLAKSGKKTKQQGVDVLLAIDAMQCSFRRSMTSCTLYTGDGDFLPLIDALVENGTFVNVRAFSNPDKGEVAPELRNRADSYERISNKKFAALLKNGRAATRRLAPQVAETLHPKHPLELKVRSETFTYYQIENGPFDDFPFLYILPDGKGLLFKDLLWFQCWVELSS